VKLAVVVVTYNRLDFLKKNLESLCGQTRKPAEIIVVDNASTDGTRDFLSRFSAECSILRVIRLTENVGGSGGFAAGLKDAISRGADWVWMMDDDAVPFPDALYEIEKVMRTVPLKTGVLLSRITDREEFSKSDIIIPAVKGTFVGFAVRREVVQKVGYPDSSFFIYADDYDYSVRIRKAGFDILKVNASVIFHKDWAKQRKLFKFPFVKPKIPSWKTYYIVRNTLNAARHIKVFYMAVKVYFFFDRFVWTYVNPETKEYVFKGFKDGINGVRGKTVLPTNS